MHGQPIIKSHLQLFELQLETWTTYQFPRNKSLRNYGWIPRGANWRKSTTGQKKIISDHHDLYLFLATSVVEVMKLLFVSVDGVWVTWHFIQKQKIPSLRHTKEVLAAYVKASRRTKLHLLPGLITRESELLRQAFRVLYSYGMRTPSSLFWRQVGKYDKRVVTRRLYGRVRYSLALELCEQASQQGFEQLQIGL